MYNKNFKYLHIMCMNSRYIERGKAVSSFVR
ncbi:hypothetical protein CLHUN_25120 [Ruminiclostridium hungatei]|uniref:Uncharacterized protein n=1 Tax=Ruminiclostridium hungatei TaxID=48256 RepID=A0A1V4SID9_RUMHU|nr:hypothetical protein CLHUN_25120 [Ruminiclostridium hungatei]